MSDDLERSAVPPARPRPDRIGLLLLLAGLAFHWLVLYSLPTGMLNPLFHDAARQPGHGLDFYSIYQSGHNVLNGMSAYYGVREHRYGPQHQVVPYFSGFRYLPVYAYTYGVFLNVLPPQASYWMWIVIVEAMLIACIWLTFLLTRHTGRFFRYAAVWLLYSPYYLELYIGQQSFVTATLIFLMGYAVLRGHPRTFDACYAASAVWKLNTLLFAPLLVRLKRFSTLAAIAVIILLTSIPYFVIDPGGFSEFISYFGHKFIADGPNSHGLWALGATVWKRVSDDTSQLRNALQMVSLAIICVSALVTFLNRQAGTIDLLAVWVLTYFLSYQYVWEHHYVMLLPVLVLLLIRHGHWFVWTCALLLCLPTPFVLLDVPGMNFPQEHWTMAEDVWLHLSKLGPSIALWLWLVGRELGRAVLVRDFWAVEAWRQFRQRART